MFSSLALKAVASLSGVGAAGAFATGCYFAVQSANQSQQPPSQDVPPTITLGQKSAVVLKKTSSTNPLNLTTKGVSKTYKCQAKKTDGSLVDDLNCEISILDFSAKNWMNLENIKSSTTAITTTEQLSLANQYLKVTVDDSIFSLIAFSGNVPTIDVVSASDSATPTPIVNLLPLLTIGDSDSLQYSTSTLLLSSGTPINGDSLTDASIHCSIQTKTASQTITASTAVTNEKPCSFTELKAQDSSSPTIQSPTFSPKGSDAVTAITTSAYYLADFTSAADALTTISSAADTVFVVNKSVTANGTTTKTVIAHFSSFKPVIYIDTDKTQGFILG